VKAKDLQRSEPCYLETHRQSKLSAKAVQAKTALSQCRLCPRQCGIDRLSGKTGFCRTGAEALVASYEAHFGEEAPLVGRHGSGTIFFTYCNLNCNFCQNYDISHAGAGRKVSDRQLADMMLQLQEAGCHNINFVTPSHMVAQILSALVLAVPDGLHVPLVYNSGGYDRVETLRLLEGVIDIYMPDFKFWDSSVAAQTCDASDYPEQARRALLEMHRQVGDLYIGADGLAQHGLLVRHLVLPEDLAGTDKVMHFIAQEISPATYVNIMSQYRPCGRAADVPALARSISAAEYSAALDAASLQGITRLDRPRRVFAWK
jgi:putative pyruvate formate lyase activating enzyme